MVYERRGIDLKGGKEEGRTIEGNNVCVMEIQEGTI